MHNDLNVKNWITKKPKCYVNYRKIVSEMDPCCVYEKVEFPKIAWWRHQIEIFSALLAISAGNSPVPDEFPAQRPVTRSFGVFFDLHPNKRLSKQWWGWWFETTPCPLRRHRNGRSLLSCGIADDINIPLVLLAKSWLKSHITLHWRSASEKWLLITEIYQKFI